jgi:hypothetical protein
MVYTHLVLVICTSTRVVFLQLADVPDRPYDVRVSSCVSGSAEVTWSPGFDNNAPITAFVVQYNTSHEDSGLSASLHDGAIVSGSARAARIRPLTPWTGYSFYVTAENAVGRSERTAVGSGSVVCQTPGVRPFRNPRQVCMENRRPGQLVIVWEVRSRTLKPLTLLTKHIFLSNFVKSGRMVRWFNHFV